MERENKTIYRYCFSASDDSLDVLKNWNKGNVQVFQYQAVKFFILEIDKELSIERLASDNGLNLDILNQTLTERIYMKMPLGDSLSDHSKANDFSESKRIAMTLEIQNDFELLAEYKRVHLPENIWEQIGKNMDTMGILDMELYNVGYRIFLIMDTPLDFDLEKEGERWGQLPREQEWQNYVSKFQKTDPESKIEEKWQMMNQLNIS